MMNKKKHHAFFLFTSLVLALSLSACVTRPIRGSRQGLFKNDSIRGADKHASYDYEQDENGHSEEISLTGKWQWPLKNIEVSSHYGNRGHKFHQGMDLRAPMRTPVLAANDGVVVYVGSKIRGYGRMVVIKHEDNFYSVYAHHSKNLVKVGKHVSRGDQIALSGKSGHASGPHLHFEIRQGTESYNPYLALNENIQKYAANRKVASENKP
jgi:murein DD-endopeptidase MepM/ murein hydrolase activator NlpD